MSISAHVLLHFTLGVF